VVRELVEFIAGDYLIKSNSHGLVECYSVLPNEAMCRKIGFVYEHWREEEMLRELALCDDCRVCITEAPN